ncbi:hypothetical protein K488DRAFT_73626 [Vararia minispora EC-137]|uniref:Uncharacterized protein n=1 Tax=Vararia minispora EC-137 TaxID=1314806 RepID=A0ACB8Q9X9_9AGAM|nr:hypothetical protein K488DRAFT_73626 [Vararia minispora EC-137]
MRLQTPTHYVPELSRPAIDLVLGSEWATLERWDANTQYPGGIRWGLRCISRRLPGNTSKEIDFVCCPRDGKVVDKDLAVQFSRERWARGGSSTKGLHGNHDLRERREGGARDYRVGGRLNAKRSRDVRPIQDVEERRHDGSFKRLLVVAQHGVSFVSWMLVGVRLDKVKEHAYTGNKT